MGILCKCIEPSTTSAIFNLRTRLSLAVSLTPHFPHLHTARNMPPKISTRISLRWLPSTEDPTEPTDTIVFGVGAYFVDLRVMKSDNSLDWALAGERQVISTDPRMFHEPSIPSYIQDHKLICTPLSEGPLDQNPRLPWPHRRT